MMVSHHTGAIRKETETVKRTKWKFQSQKVPPKHQLRCARAEDGLREPEQVRGDAGS